MQRRSFTSKHESNRNVKLSDTCQLGSCHDLEYERSFSNDFTKLEERIATSLSKLSIQHHEQEISSSHYCEDSTKELSVIYISDMINSNFQNTGSSSYSQQNENAYHNYELIRKELPTSFLINYCDAFAQHSCKDALGLESKEVAVAVHQGFFNGNSFFIITFDGYTHSQFQFTVEVV
jgi:hypothetical protein